MILTAAWVVPVTGPPIRRGFVETRDARIAGVDWAAARQLDAARDDVVDLGNVILTPGLVNPHTHLELACYRDQLAPRPLWPWLEQLIPLRREPGQEQREIGAARDAGWESLRAGVTCVGDISRRNLAWRGLKDVPLRKVCFVELLSIADQPPRDIDELRAELDAVECDSLLTLGVSPHAPYTVPAEHIRGALALAGERKLPWTTHLAETREELAFLSEKGAPAPPLLARFASKLGIAGPGMPPIAYLESCRAADVPGGALAHLNYIDAADIAQLAETEHIAVYCPRAHAFYGHTDHPFRAMQRAGCVVALGTDSPACVDDLSPLSEAHFVAEHAADSPPPAELLRMITIDAARALRLASQIGSLEAGKLADLAAFPLFEDEFDDASPVAKLIRRPRSPRAVWVAGKRVI